MPPVRIPLLAETSKPVVVWSDAMWELARDAEGGAFTAIDEEPGLEFYVAKAAVAFAVWDLSPAVGIILTVMSQSRYFGV